MKEIILSPINKTELVKDILEGVEALLDQNRVESINELENWTIAQTAEFCKVSKVTIHDWAKKGILKKYKIGYRSFFKKSEVIKAVIPVE